MRPTSTTTATDTPARVVIAHDFAEAYGGAERVVGRIAALFPEAPVWTLAGRTAVAERMGVADRFHTVLPRRERVFSAYRALAPLYPAIAARRRLPAADLLISSSYAFAHGFRTENDAPHLCFCHSPLRFAWSMTREYGEHLPGGPLRSAALQALAHGLRRADRRAAERVTRYVSASRFVAEQVRDLFYRESSVVCPPVDIDRFRPDSRGEHDDYFLFIGRLIEPYKRPSLAIEAFRASGKRLVVAGDGPAMRELRGLAGPNVEFLGQVGDEDLVPLMQRCAALIFPSRDDFGMVPIEVMACGRPVIAFGAGGALETVMPGLTGEFFFEQEPRGLRAAIDSFDPGAYDPDAIRKHAVKWRGSRFDEEFLAEVRHVRAVAT